MLFRRCVDELYVIPDRDKIRTGIGRENRGISRSRQLQPGRVRDGNEDVNDRIFLHLVEFIRGEKEKLVLNYRAAECCSRIVIRIRRPGNPPTSGAELDGGEVACGAPFSPGFPELFAESLACMSSTV